MGRQKRENEIEKITRSKESSEQVDRKIGRNYSKKQEKQEKILDKWSSQEGVVKESQELYM